MDKPAVVQRVLTVTHKALSNLKAKRPNQPASFFNTKAKRHILPECFNKGGG